MKNIKFYSFLFYFLLFTLNITNAQETTQRIVGIVNPANAGNFNCQVSTDGDNQCHFQVLGNSQNLQSGDYITLFLKIAGGGTWWRTGVSYAVLDGFSGTWVSGASVDPNSTTGQMFEVMAIVTKNPVTGPSKVNSPLNLTGYTILAHSTNGYFIIKQ
jgi:hypothetical protein